VSGKQYFEVAKGGPKKLKQECRNATRGLGKEGATRTRRGSCKGLFKKEEGRVLMEEQELSQKQTARKAPRKGKERKRGVFIEEL